MGGRWAAILTAPAAPATSPATRKLRHEAWGAINVTSLRLSAGVAWMALARAISDTPEDREERGQGCWRGSNEMVRAQKEFFGKGLTQAKSYMLDDLLLIVMRGGLTTAEKTMLEFGQSPPIARYEAPGSVQPERLGGRDPALLPSGSSANGTGYAPTALKGAGFAASSVTIRQRAR